MGFGVAEQIDLKGMSDDELISLQDALLEEIADRGIRTDGDSNDDDSEDILDFYPGVYVGGVDIKPGTYYIVPINVHLVMTIKWYESKEDVKEGTGSIREEFIKGTQKDYRLVIEEGDVLKFEVIGTGSIGIKTTGPDWAP